MASFSDDASTTPLRRRMQEDMVMRVWDRIRSRTTFDMSAASPFFSGSHLTPQRPRAYGAPSCLSVRTAWIQRRSTARFYAPLQYNGNKGCALGLLKIERRRNRPILAAPQSD